MHLLNNSILVRFEMEKEVFRHGTSELVRPKTWEFEQSDSGTTYQKQLDLRETNSQIATVVVDNTKFPFAKSGDMVFVHYLALDNSEEMEYEGEMLRMIPHRSIFFKILEDESFEMMQDVYLGESVMEEEEVSPSGIILSSLGPKRKKQLITITHTPHNSPYIQVGDVIYTIDDNQYELEVFGKKYIKMNTWDIIAKQGSQ